MMIKEDIMVRLKVFFVAGIVVTILAMCAMVPGICLDRLLPRDACCADCSAPLSSGYSVCDAGENVPACR